MSVIEDWFWEGNVVNTLALYLESKGWTIVNKADTFSKQRGVDLEAIKSDVKLLVEAKGYPSTKYRDPNRINEKKPTNPTLQSGHWYSHAILKALNLLEDNSNDIVALAFPDFPRYHKLIEKTKTGIKKLGIKIFIINEDGSVREYL